MQTNVKDTSKPEILFGQEKSYLYGRQATTAQCIATCVVGITYFGNGLLITAPTIVAGNLLNSKSDTLSLNEEEASWFGSIPFLLQPVGVLIGIFLQDYVGQRHSLFLANALSLVFYATLRYARSISILFLSSALMGLSLGFTEPSGMGYISEYSEARLRGFLSSGVLVMMNVGGLAEFVIVSMFNWRTVVLINAVVPILSLLSLPWIPDSPVWLLSKSKKAEALRALVWLRGWVTEECVREEFDDLDKYVKSSLTCSRIRDEYCEREEQMGLAESSIQKQGRDKSSVSELMTSFLERRTLRPLILLGVFQVTIFFAGSIGAQMYALNLFDALQIPIDGNYLTLTGGIARLSGSLVILLALKYTGKRILSIVTLLLTASMSICLGVYVHYKDQLQMHWLFLIFFFIQCFEVSKGGLVPWLMMGEIFPVRTRHAGSGLFGAIFDLLLFLFMKTYFLENKLLGTDMYFVTNGVIGIFGCLYLYAFLPETEGKTLNEIEKMFSKKGSS